MSRLKEIIDPCRCQHGTESPFFQASAMASLPVPRIKFVIRSVCFPLLIWIGLLCILDVSAGGDVRYSGFREFDYFKLSLQWPGTVCRGTRRCCASNGCCRGSKSPKGFTIHGLWADYNDGTWPACCRGKRFEVKEISTLLGALRQYWPSLMCGSSSNCHGGRGLFWEHEWEKHGTCSSSVTGDEYNYFLTTLNVYFKYNVTEVLQEAGYVASNSEKYPLGGIISAIQNAFHLTPEIQCSGDAVKELRLCFYKNFEPRNCAADSNNELSSEKSCPKNVSLPDYSSSRLGNAETEVSASILQSSI